MNQAVKRSVRKVWEAGYRLYGVRDNVILGKGVHLGIGTILWSPTRLVIGNNTYIGKYCTIECDGKIGENVIIANQVGLVGRHDHDHRCVGKAIRQAPWIGDAEYSGSGKKLEVIVEDDVWIGYGTVVLSGARVCRGAVVAAGSVVTKDVRPYTIVAGNPAREVAQRFERAEIEQHEQILYGRVITA